jgi:hypothetical protein
MEVSGFNRFISRATETPWVYQIRAELYVLMEQTAA